MVDDLEQRAVDLVVHLHKDLDRAVVVGESHRIADQVCYDLADLVLFCEYHGRMAPPVERVSVQARSLRIRRSSRVAGGAPRNRARVAPANEIGPVGGGR